MHWLPKRRHGLHVILSMCPCSAASANPRTCSPRPHMRTMKRIIQQRRVGSFSTSCPVKFTNASYVTLLIVNIPYAKQCGRRLMGMVGSRLHSHTPRPSCTLIPQTPGCLLATETSEQGSQTDQLRASLTEPVFRRSARRLRHCRGRPGSLVKGLISRATPGVCQADQGVGYGPSCRVSTFAHQI